MNKFDFEMITIDGDGHAPLSTGGQNTVRLWQDKYAMMKPGDMVLMNHFAYVDENGPQKSTSMEKLRVRSVVRCPGIVVQQYHLWHNHSWSAWQDTGDYTTEQVNEMFWDVMKLCYADDLGGREMQEIHRKQFLVIYFE